MWTCQKAFPHSHANCQRTALRPFNCSLTQTLPLMYTKLTAHTLSAHYVHATIVSHIQRKAIKASECWARGKICSQPEKTQHDEAWRGTLDMVSLATEIPFFYLSAGLRPVGTGIQAGTGRRHSRTLASSRTSREEAEHSLPPAGRRLTGRTRQAFTRVPYDWWYMVVPCMWLYW